jgi:hypothetical protein
VREAVAADRRIGITLHLRWRRKPSAMAQT